MFSASRLALWLLNAPVGLAAVYIGLYSFAGLWNPDTPTPLWLWAAVQPIVACISYFASATKWRAGETRSANLLLMLPLASLAAWMAAMQLW
jgi:hypothetical protein